MMDGIATPLDEIARVLDGVADGDLRCSVEGQYQGDLDALKQSVNRTIEQLSRIASDMRASAGQVQHAAEEISSGTADLSRRTEAQAASLEETAATMEQMTATVKQSADNARQASQLATGARSVAERGGAVVQQAVSAMEEINKASAKIADIIGVIDAIAFQTNLLALNAAVEAARAGEQGRGFAVVASEVRNLAQRSASAAKEIKALIKDSSAKVEDGSRLVQQSGSALSEIVSSVKQVAEIVAEISVASQEQSSAIEQVNDAVTKMDESTQRNSALVEETAGSAASLAKQGSELLETVGQFRVAEEQGAEQELVSRVRRADKAERPRAKVHARPVPARVGSPAPKAPAKRDALARNGTRNGHTKHAGDEDFLEF
jgi:methyl-accepting chemotaxis protein